MIKEKIKKYVVIGLILASVAGCLLLGGIFHKEEEVPYTRTVVASETVKACTKDMVVDNIKELQEINVLQLQVSKIAKLSKGEFFEKTQQVKFRLNCTYSLDLSTIEKDNVIINNNTVTIYTKEPTVSVSYLEDKTEFSEVDKKWYDMGSKLEMTSEEFESIKSEIKKIVYEESGAEMDVAKENCVKAIESALLTLTKEDYSIIIKWVV